MWHSPIILAIETSFDDTAVAVVDASLNVLSNVVSSQLALHERYGGVVPEIASRAHVEAIMPVLEQAVRQAFGPGNARDLIDKHVDALAVTDGPGLIGSLLVGVNTARALAASLDMPLIPVHHILGHVYSNFVAKSEIQNSKHETNSKFKISNNSDFGFRHSNLFPFPFLTLVVSGGHTELILSRAHTDHLILGQTRDDAAGEAFDKAAHILGLGYPGGAALAHVAEHGDATAYTLPRAMSHDKSLDFSFSGLKTALAQLVKQLHLRQEDINPLIPDLAASFQAAVIDTLMNKVTLAVEQYPIPALHLAGGVAANKALRQRFVHFGIERNLAIAVPHLSYCTDNAAMVGAAAQAAMLTRDHFPWYDCHVERQPKLTL